MDIKKVRFVNCNRFTTAGKRDITIRPKKKIIMLLGTNGSGKTSLMNLGFTPILPDKNNFDKGGKWEFECTDNGHHYLMSANYTKNKYSFMKDGTELNPGGTITSYNQLLEQEFNYNQHLHKIFTGLIKFTTMSPMARRDAIAKVSNADFTYAFSRLSEFQKGLSSTQSVRKYIHGKLVEAKEKLMDEAELKELEDNLNSLRGRLDELQRIPREPTDDITKEQLLQLMERQDKSFKNFFRKLDLPVLSKSTVEDTKGDLYHKKQKLEEIETQSNVLSNQMMEVEGKLNMIGHLSDHNLDDLNKSVLEIKQKLSEIPKKNIDIPDEWLVDCGGLVDELVSSLSVLGDKYIIDDEWNKMVSDVDRMSGSLSHMNDTMNLLVGQLKDYMNVSDVTCPTCSTIFKPGVEQQSIDHIKGRIEAGSNHIARLEKELEAKSNEINSTKDIYLAQKNLYNLRNDLSSVYPGIFSYIDLQGGFKKGSNLITPLVKYGHEVRYKEMRGSLESKLVLMEQAIEHQQQKSGEYLTLMDSRDRLKKEWEELYSLKRQLSSEIDRNTKQLEYKDQYDLRYESIISDHEKVVSGLRSLLLDLQNKMIDEEHERLTVAVGVTSSKIQSNALTVSTVEDLERQLNETTIREKAYRALVDALSPKTGLIAEQIKEQIGSMVGVWNTFIKKVWNHEFFIELPSEDGGDLNYRFPIVKEGVRRSDVSEGSSSMKDVVDVAFPIIAQMSIGKEGFPIYLDEFGGTFDAVHSENVIKLIKDLSDSRRFGYVVVISHNESVQNAFPDADIIVLDDRNIELDREYNTCVEFK